MWHAGIYTKHVPPNLSRREVTPTLQTWSLSVIQLPVVVRIRVDGEKEKTGFRSAARVAGFNWMLYLDDPDMPYCRASFGHWFQFLSNHQVSDNLAVHDYIVQQYHVQDKRSISLTLRMIDRGLR